MYRTLDSFESVELIGNVLIVNKKYRVFISERSGLRGVNLSGKELVMKAEDENGRTFLYLDNPATTLTFGNK